MNKNRRIVSEVMKRLAVITVLACIGNGLVAADGDLADKNKPPVQVFYNPLPEEDVLTALIKIQGDYTDTYRPASPMYSYTYISIFCDNTVIYYDQWENGYEADIANPISVYSKSNPAGTQIWGDGDLSNGCAPGTSDDILNSGTIVKLISEVDTSKRGTEIYFDASDKWGSSKPVAASRTVWASNSKTLFAGANEMFDTSFFGTEFVCPCGTDTANQNEVFQYTGFSVMAGEGGATISYSLDGTTVAGRKKLKEGEAFLINGDIKQGGWVKATAGTVQVELITGDILDYFESRFIKILPRSMWNTSYTCPIATPKTYTSGKNTYDTGTKIWIYNPEDTALAVTYKYRTSSAIKSATISVPAKSAKAIVPASGTSTSSLIYTGAESATYLSADKPFYALATINATGTDKSTTKKTASDNSTWDWGCALVPDASLSTQILVGLGLGCDPNSSKSENAAPIWVSTPSINGDTSFNASTTVYVKYDASTAEGRYTDPNGNKYDKKFTLHPLEMYKLYNDSATTDEQKKNGQTGMTFWTLDGTKLAAAWGEDPTKATRGDPGVDMGTGIPPMPELILQKRSKLVEDKDGDGYLSCGDVLEYTVDIVNVGRMPITDIRFGDNLSQYTSYVRGNNLWIYMNGDVEHKYRLTDAIWDEIASGGHLITASDLGLSSLPVLGIGQTWTLCYYIQIGDEPVDEISNFAWANNHGTQKSDSVIDFLRSKVGDYVWLDSDNDGVQDADEIGIKGAVVSLVDEDGNVVIDDFGKPYTQTTGDDGKYLFLGVKPGTYTVKVDVPEVYLPTKKDAAGNDIADSDINVSFETDPFEVHGGRSYLDVDAGLVVRQPPASIEIVKTASDATIGIGKTVTYTYKVTNTGHTHLHDVVVTDDKLGKIGSVSGILAPGESAVLTATATLEEDTTNIGTVVGIPGDKDGNDLTGVPPDPVSDTDDETVKVVDQSAWIGDYVWVDIDNDGIQDADENGLEGVKVTLNLRTITTTTETKTKWVNGRRVTETVTTVTTNDSVVATKTTDADGAYVFKGLDATVDTSAKKTTYFVTFENPDGSLWAYSPADQGADDSVDSDADKTGRTADITIASSEHNKTIDCGFNFIGNGAIEIVKTASSNLVEPDTLVTYTYAVKNIGKTYLADIVVTDDKIAGQTKTIDLLAPGETKTVTMSAKISSDTTNVATATGTVSDSKGNPLKKEPVTDTDDENVKVIIHPATIGDFVWVDVNGDGLQNDNFPLAGVTVKLLKGDDVVATTTTDANGVYSFTVKPEDLGAYRVQFVAPEGFAYTTKGNGTANDSDANKTGITDSVVLASGDNRTDIDCGLVFNGNASVSIVKTAGAAADGEVLTIEKGSAVNYTYVVKNTGSVALSNVKVVDDKLGDVGTIAGVLLPGASRTLTKSAAAIDGDVTNVGTVTGTPSSNEGKPYTQATVTDNDDAVVTVYELGSIEGIVWIDANGDGIQNDTNVKPGVTVKLVDGNGDTIGTTTTDANGGYKFDNLVPGDYRVVVSAPDGLVFTEKDKGGNDNVDSDVTKTGTTDTIVLASGENKKHVDAGLTGAGEPSIEIVKLAGDAADGTTYKVQKDTAFNWTITVRNTGKTHLKDLTVSDEVLDKSWNIDMLAPGESKTITAADIATKTLVNTADVSGTSCDSDGIPLRDEPVTDSDDADVEVYELGTIGDFAWIDVNGNGKQDDGEVGLDGVTVKLFDADGQLVQTTTTANGGAYLFKDVLPGSYTVSFSKPATFDYTKQNVADDIMDSDVDATGKTDKFTLASGGSNLTVDAGYVYDGSTASINIVKTAGDAADGDTLRVVSGSNVTYSYKVTNTGLVGLKNIVVTDDKLVGKTETIAYLAPGASATVTMTGKLDVDTVNVGTATGTPCDTTDKHNPLTDKPVSDDDDAIVDVYELASLGDKVWIDVDGDGVQDAGEQGVANAKVLLYADGSDEPVAFTFTDESGNYKFENLEPGKYRVEVVNPQIDLYAFTAQDASNDAVDSDVDATGATETFVLVEGQYKDDVDAGLVLKDGSASIDLVKLAGDAADGATLVITNGAKVTYSFIVKNTGKVALADVVLTDETYGVTTVIGFLKPGEETTKFFEVEVDEDVTNIASVEGTPADGDGTPISSNKVTDTDDAKVSVVIPTSTIGDYVWNDADNDGVQDDGEVGIYGVVVQLCDAATSNVIATTTTDAKGGYHFDVEPGEYVIHFVPSSAWDVTKPYAATEENDSNADENGWTESFTVANGTDNLTLDCGLVGGVPPGICDLIAVAYNYNAFILGDFTTLGGDSEGNLLVGGNANLAGGYTVGLIGPGYGRIRDAADADTDALVVGGNLTEKTYQPINGNVVYGGEYSNPSAYNSRSYGMRHVDPVTLDDNWNVPEDLSGRTLASVAQDVAQFSLIVSELGERGNPVYDGKFWTASDGFRNIFAVTDEEWVVDSLHDVTVTNLPVGSKVVVNVYSKNVEITRGSVRFLDANGDEIDPELVLFNFVNATNITATSFTFAGSVLAPKAETATLAGGSIDGFAFFGGNVHTSVGFEFHDFGFRAFDCSNSDVVTQRPSLDVVVTAGDAKDGAILDVAVGADVEVTAKITNTSDFDIRDITVNAFGIERFVDLLAAGDSIEYTTTAAAAEEGTLTYAASASGYGVGSAAFEGIKIGDSDLAKIDVAASAEALEAVEIAKEAAEVKWTYIPRPDFEIDSVQYVNGFKPSQTGEVFSVYVTLKNSGEVAAKPGRVAVGFWAVDGDGNVSFVKTGFADVAAAIEPGAVSAPVLVTAVAPLDAGYTTFRVVVDDANAVNELSESNNHWVDSVRLSKFLLSIATVDEGILLEWTSYNGEGYVIYGSKDLKTFEPVMVKGKSFVEATPPTNSVLITPEDTDCKFFKVFADQIEVLNPPL